MKAKGARHTRIRISCERCKKTRYQSVRDKNLCWQCFSNGGRGEGWAARSKRMIKNSPFCEICQVSNEKAHLAVHHKNSIKHDNREENLQILCFQCHKSIHMNEHKGRQIKEIYIGSCGTRIIWE